MGRFTPSRRGNPCPICEDISGKCREHRDGEIHLCMIYADTRKGEIVAGYKCIGHTRDQLWGQFKLEEIDRGEPYGQRILQRNHRSQTQGRTSSIPVSPVQRQVRNQPDRMAANGENVSSCGEKPGREANHLLNGERDRAIRKLRSHFGLSVRHAEDLRKRGLTDSQIERQLYFSITPNQEVPFGIPTDLPGVKDGQIKAAGTGYACVTFDHQGRATGWQVRLDNATDNKYRWAKGEQSSHLSNGELPITSVYSSQIKHSGIWICEGISKPAIASHRLGIVAIGAASANFASSPQQTEEHLKAASERLETKEVIFAPDGGAVNNSHILKAYKRSWELFAKLGYQVKVAWWGQVDKTHSDIDELDDLSKVELINPEDFLSWAETASSKDGQWLGKQEESQTPIKRKSLKTPSTESKSVNPKRYIKPIQELPELGFHVIRHSQDELLGVFDALKTKRGQEWLQLRRFTPDVIIDSQYFDYDFKPGENLAINSGLGTGKSYFTNAKWLANPDEGAVLGGYRNCLNEQFCANGKKLNGRPWYQIQADLKNSQDAALIADPQSRIAGAVDSWIYFSPHHFDEKKVIFDEAESVAKHLNQSSTAVAFYREIIKKRVSDALTSSMANLIADGNLRDFTVEYFEKLSGGKKFTKILNTYTGNRGRIHLYNGSSRKRKATEEDVKNGLAIKVDDWISFDHKPDDYSKLHRVMVDLPIDIPLLVLSDSQKKCEAWDRELSAKGRKVFRLDSTTSTSDLGRLFLQNPKGFILSEKIDAVILSPSAESGVSIELMDELKREIPGYFKYEFAFFFGVSVTDTQTQFLGRNRDPYTNKFLYVQTHSMPVTRQITDEENSQDIFSMWAETMKDCASLSLQGLEEGEILKIALEKIKAQLLDPHTQYESKLLLKESFEQKYPRLCLEYALRESGWEVLTVESRQDDLSDLRAMEKEIAEQKAIAVFSAEEITSTEADQLARKLNKFPEERNQIAKSRLISRLPGITEKVITVEKVVQDEEQFKQIEESELEKVVKVQDLSYPEWQNSPSKEIPSSGIKVTVEKPAFDPDFVNKVLYQDRAFVSRIEAQFLLRNPELCKLIQQHKWHKKLDLLTDPDSVSFGGLPMSRYRSRWLEIHTLYQMGIGFFLDPENIWHDESPQALSFWQQGKIPRNARKIGVKHEDDPCTYIGKVLKKFGLKTQELKQKTRPDGTRYREYSIREIDPLSQAVYECLEQRIKNQVSEFNFDWEKIVKNSGFKTAETLTNQSLQPAHLQPNNYIEARVEVCREEEGKEKPQELASTPCVTLSSIEELREAFSYCESSDDFAAVVEGFEPDVVDEAIASSDSQPKRQQLRMWFEQIKSAHSPVEPKIAIGTRLKFLSSIGQGFISKVRSIFEDCFELESGDYGTFSEVERGYWAIV